MKEVLVLGLGNILWADEGFGVRAVESFHATYRDRNDVDVMDGGTLGSYLMNAVMDAKRLLILDCCDLKAKPGTLRVLRDDDIRVWSSTKISAHQTGMNDVLAKAMLLGYEPEAITVMAGASRKRFVRVCPRPCKLPPKSCVGGASRFKKERRERS